MEEEKREHAMKLKKMEAEMEQVFESKVKEKKQKLKESEADVSLCSSFIFGFSESLKLRFKCFIFSPSTTQVLAPSFLHFAPVFLRNSILLFLLFSYKDDMKI